MTDSSVLVLIFGTLTISLLVSFAIAAFGLAANRRVASS